MKVAQIVPRFVEYVPDRPEPGVLYISQRFRTCSHLCCCGCGEEVVTPLSEAEWTLTRHGDLVSLWPSVGNWDYACQSHYVIERNQVRWARRISKIDIARVKQRDALDLQRMVARQRRTGRLPACFRHYLDRATTKARAFIDRFLR